MTDDGARWDISQRYDGPRRFLLRVRPSLTEAVYLHAYPELLPHWQGPVDPHQARIADNAMADLGGVLLNQAEWELEQIERRNGF